MTDKPDSISALARQLGIPELALKDFLSLQQDVWFEFAEGRGIDPSTLKSFQAQLKSQLNESERASASHTYMGPQNESLPPLRPSADTMDPDMFFSDAQTVQFSRVQRRKASVYGVATVPEDISGVSDVTTTVILKQTGNLGRYEDLGLLGVGGMGEVRQVRDGNLRRTMAMKIIHPSYMERPRLVSRFVEEAQIQAQLQHPNIVPIYEIEQLPDGRHYFTMKQIRGTEFSEKIGAVHGASLDDRWRPADDGTTFRDLIRIHQQVCETVAYAHSQGVLHRDLKPENIMIGGFGEVLVVDWGLAKVLGREEDSVRDDEGTIETVRSDSSAHQTRMGSVTGTPCYMAPEQAFGKNEEVGTATDVYTLGAILYEILSGLPPFSGASAEEVIEKVKHSGPSVLRELDEGRTIAQAVAGDAIDERDFPAAMPISVTAKIPERLARICESAMQREIGDRTASAQDLAAELRSWLEGAEKREKGLNEVEKARLLAEQAQGQERKSAAEWREANALMERDGGDSEEGWALWSSSQESETESRKLWRRYVRQLQGALVHAPDLEEAHEALARQRLDELIAAAAVGDRTGRETREQQLNAHLAMLPSILRTELEATRDQGLADVISGQRFRRGALVGRHAQREAVASQVDGGARVLTLLGTAGVGKTRLALELAEDLRTGFSRTVFCDLTEATDGLGIARRMSRALQVRLRDTDPIGHLTEVLGSQPTLLVLDNLEQLTEVIGPMISTWSEHCEGLQLLCTSRLRLGIGAEVVVPIQPLSLLEGVDLFVRRGQAADPGFEFTTAERPALCALVRKLDSLPLALELAAARLNILSLDELSVRLNERFSLLRSRGRDAKALDGALDWSWGLLQPWAKAALSQASLFRGGFTLAAAEGVIDVGRHPKTPAMFDILGELVDNSLLRKDQIDSGRVRYSLLESIRAYATFKLGNQGEMGPELRGQEAMERAQRRHAVHYSHLGTPQALRALDGFDSTEKWEVLFRELDNLVAAIGYGTSKTAPLCCLAALKVLGMKGPVSLGVDISTRVLQMENIGKREQIHLEIARSKCLRISGRMDEARAMVGTTSLPRKVQSVGGSSSATARPATESSDQAETTSEKEPGSDSEEQKEPVDAELLEFERLIELGRIEEANCRYEAAIKCYENALKVCRQNENRSGEARAIGNLGTVFKEMGQYATSVDYFTQSIEILRQVGDQRNEGRYLGNLGNVFQALGQHESAIDCYEQSVDLLRISGDRLSEANAIGNLGTIYKVMGQHERAIEHYHQAIQVHRDIGDRRAEGICLSNLGLYYLTQGQVELAIREMNQALQINRQVGDVRTEATSLGNLGDAYFALKHHDKAKAHYRQAISKADGLYPLAAGVFRGSLAHLLAIEGDRQTADRLIEEGQVLVATNPGESAKFLCKKGQVLYLAGQRVEALEALQSAKDLSEPLRVNSDSDLGQAISALERMIENGPELGQNSDLK